MSRRSRRRGDGGGSCSLPSQLRAKHIHPRLEAGALVHSTLQTLQAQRSLDVRGIDVIDVVACLVVRSLKRGQTPFEVVEHAGVVRPFLEHLNTVGLEFEGVSEHALQRNELVGIVGSDGGGCAL